MQLHTATSGSGEHHVGLIHGLGADGTTWQPLLDLMLVTGRYPVTTVDLRGHGRSDRASSYSLGELADDVVESLTQGLHNVLPDAMAAGLEREGWDIRRISGVHHDMHLEDPERVFGILADVL
ncbi:alpha/beta fold hydrolase [Microbacterium sp. LWH13-1.2]|uniref:alpha/beta fold hydrolase n=1 Tax=Microbacterium sp. LWH13-1.2 TaxID=3135260 RepID=UPI0031389A72